MIYSFEKTFKVKTNKKYKWVNKVILINTVCQYIKSIIEKLIRSFVKYIKEMIAVCTSFAWTKGARDTNIVSQTWDKWKTTK